MGMFIKKVHELPLTDVIFSNMGSKTKTLVNPEAFCGVSWRVLFNLTHHDPMIFSNHLATARSHTTTGDYHVRLHSRCQSNLCCIS